MSFLSIFNFDSSNHQDSSSSKGNPKTLERKQSNTAGDNGHFLQQLIKILDNPNRRDNTPLSLNATALEYIAVYIDRSREIGLNELSMNEKRGVRKLERLLMQVQHLTISPSKSLRRVDVSAFSALQVLEVSGISISCLENHVSLRSQLKSLKFEKHRLDSVASLLAPGLAPMLPSFRQQKDKIKESEQEGEEEEARRNTIVATHGKSSYFADRPFNSQGGLIPFPKSIDSQDGGGSNFGDLKEDENEDEDEEWKAFQWHKLYKLVLNECELSNGLSDGMLRLAWQVRVVELRQNSLTTVEKIFHHCEMLEHLDLSHNLLKSLPMLHLTMGNVSVLILASNMLTSTRGLDRLYSLTEADLGYNHIQDINEIRRLASLPNLEHLWLRGNPIAIGENAKNYRSSVFKVFIEFGDRGGSEDYPTLDGTRVSTKERGDLAKQSFVRATKSSGATSSQHHRESFSLSAQPIAGPSVYGRGRGDSLLGRDTGGAGKWGNSFMTSFNGSFAETYNDLRESFSGGGGGMGGSFSSAYAYEPRQAEYGGGRRGRNGSFGSSFNGSFSEQVGSVWEPGQDQRRGRAMSGGGGSFSMPSNSGGGFGNLKNIMEGNILGSTQHKRRRRKKIVVIEDMPDKYIEEDQAKAAALLDGYIEQEDNRPTPMLYTTTYVPPPAEVSKARHHKRMSLSKMASQGAAALVHSPRGSIIVGGEDEEELKVTLADEILKMPENQVKNVAKCKRCGCLLPTDMEALEKHQEECNGSHFLATSRAMSHRMRSSNRRRPRDDHSDDEDDDNDYTVSTPGDDMPDIMPSGMKLTEESKEGGGGIPWSVRLEKIGENLRNAVTVVKVHRLGKRLLRKSFRGNEAIAWLLENHPEGCRDEEQAWVLGRTMVDNGILIPLFHEDSFRLAALNYRFQRDHDDLINAASYEVKEALQAQNSRHISSNSSAANEISTNMTVTAADYGQFEEGMLLDMVERMRGGISVKTRVPYRNLASVAQAAGCYRRCFKGSDAVEWMIKTAEAIDEKEAIEVGHSLIWNGLIYPCVPNSSKKYTGFEDSKTSYYRFSHAWITRKVVVNTAKNNTTASSSNKTILGLKKKLSKSKEKEKAKEAKRQVRRKEKEIQRQRQRSVEADNFNRSVPSSTLPHGGLESSLGDNDEDIEEEEFLRQVVESSGSFDSVSSDGIDDDDNDNGDQDDQVVYEEALTPTNIVALGRRMRLVPGLVKDREDVSIASSAYSVLSGLIENEPNSSSSSSSTAASTMNNSSSNTNTTAASAALNDANKNKLTSDAYSGGMGDFESSIDLDVAFPLTFFGSDAISWMMETYGLVDEEDALVIGDLLLHNQVIKEVEAVATGESLRESLGWGDGENEKSTRGFQNKKCYYRFLEDDLKVNAELAERDRRLKEMERRVIEQKSIHSSSTNKRQLTGVTEAIIEVDEIDDERSSYASSNESDVDENSENNSSPSKNKLPPGGRGSKQHHRERNSSSGMSDWEAAAALQNPTATTASATGAGRARASSTTISVDITSSSNISSSVGTTTANNNNNNNNNSSGSKADSSAVKSHFVEVRVPLKVKEGDIIEFDVGNGQTARACMPKGIKGGAKMKIKVKNQESKQEENATTGDSPIQQNKVDLSSNDSSPSKLDLAAQTSGGGASAIGSKNVLTYVGDQAAGEFTLGDDFQLYCRLQIFAPNQNSGPPRMCYRVNPRPGNGVKWGVEGTSLLHLSSRWKDEEMMFAQQVSIMPWQVAKPVGMGHIFSEVPRLGIEGTDTKETDMTESSVWLVVTDAHVYIMENPAIFNDGKGADRGLLPRKFNTCPRPVVLRRYPILCLDMVKIGFFFQSLVLHFSNNELDASRSAQIDPLQLAETSNVPIPPLFLRQPGGFVLLTRDKAMTSSVLAQFTDAVKKSRQKCRPPILEELPTLNMDDVVLNDLAAISIGQVCIFQPLFQRWKSRVGVLAARTLVMTDEMLYVCSEDHSARNTSQRFVVLDSAPLKDVSAVRPEDLPEHVTILIKRALKQKRWRFQLTHRRVAEKFVSDIRQKIGADDAFDDEDTFSVSTFDSRKSQKSVFSRGSTVF